LTRIFGFIDSPEERPWVAMGAFAIFVMLGCLWIHQAQVLPGVSSTETGLKSTIIDMKWNAEGTEALALVSSDSNFELMLRSANGDWSSIDCQCNPLSIGGSTNSWVVGGENGWFGHMSPESQNLMPRSLEWPGVAPDIISLDGDISSGWMIVEGGNGIRSVQTWNSLQVSNSSTSPLESVILTEIEAISSGALIIGYDLSAGNPADGPTAEVLIAATSTLESPQLDLLHLGAGSILHTIIPIYNGPWASTFVAIVAGGDSVYGVQMDHSVHRIPGASGSETIAMDDNGALWMSEGSNVETFGMGDSESQNVVLPENVDIDTSFSAGENIVMLSSDGSVRITIDPSAQHSVLQSLQLLGDLILILILIAFAGFGGFSLLNKHEVI
jgi:hypothetical protein